MSLQCVEIQVEKARVFPSGHHGDKCKVGDNGVIAIELIDGAMVITALKDSKPCRFVVRDWLHGKLAADSATDEVTCEDCSRVFANLAAFKGHRRTCKPDSGRAPASGG